jgi:hypothetical protein
MMEATRASETSLGTLLTVNIPYSIIDPVRILTAAHSKDTSCTNVWTGRKKV